MTNRLKYILFAALFLCSTILTACGGAYEDTAAGSSVAKQMLIEEIPTPKPASENAAASPDGTSQSTSSSGEAEKTSPDGTSQVTSSSGEAEKASPDESAAPELDPNGSYYDLEHVVLYLNTYNSLPPNYITKKAAEDLGWEGGTVEKYMEGAAIGGTKFGNYEGVLPAGTSYHECDLDTHPHKPRGAKRLVYSDNGKYYYTDDHYEHFREVIVNNGHVELTD